MRYRGQGDRGLAAETFSADSGDEGTERIWDYTEGGDPRSLWLVHEVCLEEFWYQDRAVSLGKTHGDLTGMRRQTREDLQMSNFISFTTRARKYFY